ncbi:MAG: tagaturonate epimerase family protein [Deltaproteobacteria bacterium]|nr:tagaturonate epimerase family protein [Deltaproteobacteria bacterium]
MKTIERYSMGAGDRFGRQGAAQIAAFRKAREKGVDVAIVWNKSNREHLLTGTGPADQRAAADQAIKQTGWDGPWYVDADHIGLATVDRFAPHCDFFTLDVADYIGKSAAPEAIEAFAAKHANLLTAKGIPARLDAAAIRAAAGRYLHAVDEAAKTYRRICELRKGDDFVTEVSMDETAVPQSPAELIVILAALADAGVPVQTLAPKFSGRFNKGVDYVGDIAAFFKEFEADVRVAGWSAGAFGLPKGLKLSVHTGSDKFSLYKGIGEIIRKEGAGLHLKTAGTTWLEEIVGLADSGGDGLATAKEIYRAAYGRFDEVVAPYAEVINIDRKKLPSPDEVDRWEGPTLVAALRHVQTDQRFDPGMRQLVHVGFAVVASMGGRFYEAVERHKAAVSRNVTVNLWERHLVPLFIS